MVPPLEGAKGIIGGSPGHVWFNDTGEHRWQLFVNVHKDYGYCFQRWGHIGHYWGIPHCKGCTCVQKPVKPGESAAPFIDLGAELAKLGPAETDALMGRCNWILFSSGLAGWSDIVAWGRIGEFHEVMDLKSLSVIDMIRAGVPEADARAAWELVHTPKREAIDTERRKLIGELRALGVTDSQIVDGVSEQLLGRVKPKPEGTR